MNNQNELKFGIRNSKLFLNEIYFWTNTIHNWTNLLTTEKYKGIIIDSLKFLVDRNKVGIYGFVIMPNHIHLIWEMLDKNGKELPHASFNKFTSHQFLTETKRTIYNSNLNQFKVIESERKHRFWQRDPLAIKMDSKEKLEQKLDYIHLNPLQEKWNLVNQPEDYKWSSALFYENGVDEFSILTHYMDKF